MHFLTCVLFTLLGLVALAHSSSTAPYSNVFEVIPDPKDGEVLSFNQVKFEAFLSQYEKFGAFHFSFINGNSRAGKSTVENQRVVRAALRNYPKVEFPAEGPFETCDKLKPCTKGINVVAVPRADGTGTDFFFDMEGGNLAEHSKIMSQFLSIGACASSGPLVIVDTELNDSTLQHIARVAAHMIDQDSESKTATCSFRQGGPSLVVIINRNDGAVRQEQEPGGLHELWSTIVAANDKEGMLIRQVFGKIQVYALPYAHDLSEVRSLTSPFGFKVEVIDKLMLQAAKPVTLSSEAQKTCTPNSAKTCPSPSPSRFQGTAATTAAAFRTLVDNANAITSKKGKNFQSSPRISDFVKDSAKSASSTCLQTFSDSIAQWSKPSCHEQCSGDAGGCEVVQQWVQPARSAAEACFAERTAKWRGSSRDSGKVEDPFGPSVLDPALQQLRRDVQGKADALQGAWQYANSVDPAKTFTETRTREVAREIRRTGSPRYGGPCVLGVFGGEQYADFATYVRVRTESRTLFYKRCGAADANRSVDWHALEEHEVMQDVQQRYVCNGNADAVEKVVLVAAKLLL